MNYLSKCHCIGPGICPVFKRLMGSNPPDWEWCQNASQEERESFFRITSKAMVPPIEKLTKEYEEFGYSTKWFYLYALLNESGFHDCKKNKEPQTEKFHHMVKLLEKPLVDKTCDNVEILCLGHHEKQFVDFPSKNFLKPVNLSALDAGKYSDNKWAETRAFLVDGLFSENAQFTGMTTVSWNDKYEDLPIESFDKWYTAKLLLNSTPEDKIVLCADTFCPCCWISRSGSISNTFYTVDMNDAMVDLLEDCCLDTSIHIRVPFGNQIIAHKNFIEDFTSFIKNNDVLDKVDEFANKNHNLLRTNSSVASQYHNIRVQAYLMEMVSCFWLANKNYYYFPNVKRRGDWYSPRKVKKRINDWETGKK